MTSQAQFHGKVLKCFSFNKTLYKMLCSVTIDVAIVFLVNSTSKFAKEAFRVMKGSMKYIIDKYGNDRAKYHIIIRPYPNDKSFQSHEICFNTNHVDVTALTDAVEELQRENEDVPALHEDLQKACEAFESNTLKRDAEKVGFSS